MFMTVCFCGWWIQINYFLLLIIIFLEVKLMRLRNLFCEEMSRAKMGSIKYNKSKM